MIVLDGSALFSILLHEPERDRCAEALELEPSILLSAASLAEILIVAAAKNMLEPAQEMLAALAPTVIPVTEQRARSAAEAYQRWGKRIHAANLNIMDSFAYALAMEHRCPLLFVGNDFAQTDVIAALT